MKRIFYDEIHFDYRNVLSAQDAKVPVLRRLSIDHIWAVFVLFSDLMNFVFFFFVLYLFFILSERCHTSKRCLAAAIMFCM